MAVGFEFHEVMSGTYTRSHQPDQTGHIRFSARVRAPSLIRHLRDGMAELDGTLDMEGFADDVPISGTIEIRVLFGRLIRYDFSFLGNDGAAYRFAGQKDIRLDDLATTMTHLGGSVTDARGNEVARAQVAFDVRADLLPFLISWRPLLQAT
jgi:hypothetical protein